MKIGYVRVSTEDQNTARQEALMESLAVDELFLDRMSGKSCHRPELQRMMTFVRKGDTVIVESMDQRCSTVPFFGLKQFYSKQQKIVLDVERGTWNT